MAKVTIAVFDRTLHVEDPDNDVPFEYGLDGKIIQGGKASRSVAPCTPVELEAIEADRVLAQCKGTRIPDGVPNARRWLYEHGERLKIPLSLRGALAHG